MGIVPSGPNVDQIALKPQRMNYSPHEISIHFFWPNETKFKENHILGPRPHLGLAELTSSGPHSGLIVPKPSEIDSDTRNSLYTFITVEKNYFFSLDPPQLSLLAKIPSKKKLILSENSQLASFAEFW